MMNSPDDIANRIVALRSRGQPIPSSLLSGCDTLEDGLQVQGLVIRRLGTAIAGWKIALPPDGAVLWAPILAGDVFSSPSVLPLADRLVHGVECELAFRVGQLLPAKPDGGYTSSDVAMCIGGVMAAFELLHSRLSDGFQSPRPHLLADRLGNGGVVLGEPRTDWRWRDHADLPIEVRVDGATSLSKQGGNPVGDPFRAVVALANSLTEYGMALEPGQVVMTGSYTGVQHLKPGQSIEARFEGLEPVQLLASHAGQSPHEPEESLNAGR
jgi:2-keto-4-pentenoate hydratase